MPKTVNELYFKNEFTCVLQNVLWLFKQHTELYGDSANRRYTIFDKIFKGALEKFRKELKSQIAIEGGVSQNRDNAFLF